MPSARSAAKMHWLGYCVAAHLHGDIDLACVIMDQSGRKGGGPRSLARTTQYLNFLEGALICGANPNGICF